MKRTKKVLLTLMVCFITVFAMAMAGEAAGSKPTCAKSKTVYVQKGFGGRTLVGMTDIEIKNLSKKAKITNIKSSNPKIAVAYFSRSENSKGLSVRPAQFYKLIKAKEYPNDSNWNIVEGTTRITFTVKQNGKSYKLSCKYTLKRQPSPLKSLKINGKQYAFTLKGRNTKTIKVGKSTAKISFTGRNLKSLKISYSNSKGKEVIVKNNSKVAVPKNTGRTLQIECKYKNGDAGLFYVTLQR